MIIALYRAILAYIAAACKKNREYIFVQLYQKMESDFIKICKKYKTEQEKER